MTSDQSQEAKQLERALSALKRMEEKLRQNEEKLKSATSSAILKKPIAIIGISGQFPGAKNLPQFWNNLQNGIDSVTEVPKERWDIGEYYNSRRQMPGKTYCKWGGFLDDIDKFDALFFNLSAREAEACDPQQRLFLEESWRALEDAGYSAEALSEKRVGVFAGVRGGDYIEKLKERGADQNTYALLGSDLAILAARISYYLNLKGPNMSIDTACSSSLVAIHLACQSILNGEAEMALAGGVCVMTTPNFYIMASNTGMLSPKGKCKTFDDRADGFVPGEGVGVVVLKLLEKAIEDRDHIYGVIKGSGINHDGKTNGITAPNLLSQAELESEVYDNYKIDPESITYVETHGTGTKLGDPIEVDALTQAYRKYTNKMQYCAVGSVKTNIGHTLAAAGVAGVIKILLALKHKKIPPSLNFEKANEHINFQDSPFYVNTQLKEWETEKDKPRRAAISSFGFSGTNCHMVIEEAPIRSGGTVATSKPYYLIPLSAKTKAALNRTIEDLENWLEEGSAGHSIDDIAYTLQVGRSHFGVRSALMVKDLPELKQKIRALGEKGTTDNCSVRSLKELPSKPDPRRIMNELREGQALTEAEYKEKLLTLADWYVKGEDLDWGSLYKGGGHQRISLPTYPFAKERHWIH